MSDQPSLNRRRFSAEKARPPGPPPAQGTEAPSQREISNEDVLRALLVMSEGIRAVVAETVAAEMAGVRETLLQEIRGGGVAAPAAPAVAAVTPDELRAVVAETVAGQMAELRQAAPAPRGMDEASFSDLGKELSDIMAHIEKTKAEIAALRPQDENNDQIVIATTELDAVVEATEAATSEILEHAEKVGEIVVKLRDDCSANRHDAIETHIGELEEISTGLMIACSFQDITGQRINKVVNTLLYIEQHISAMMAIWKIDRGTGESHLMVNAPDDDRPDKDLLNGPQLGGGGVNQADIDALFD
ncbi:MAG: protein phosphatase CheZ [Alphaproteobacteria bacterium]